MMKVFVFYPPGNLYQRGEDRCVIDVKSSTANAMRACNDLGYMAAVLRGYGDDVFLMDYATENKTLDEYIRDIKAFQPDVIILSTTNTTIYKDIEIINTTYEKTGFNGRSILKGAIFFNAPMSMLNSLELQNIDVLIGGEVEWVIADVVHELKPSKDIPCIIYRRDDGSWEKTDFTKYNDNLDSVPFPARDLMNNSLYIRPDTGEPMATIQTGHGCPSNCIYCLTPHISGKMLRLRSPQNVLEEMKECFHKYGIRNFFFRADTFTYNGQWVLDLCEGIKNSELYGKIGYTANSRVKPLTEDVLQAMKDTGCFTIAFGLETGSKHTMERIRKGVTVEDNYRAVSMAKKIGIPVLGFFMMGFPWEDKKDLLSTRKMMFDLDCDYIEIHVPLPYYGTELYDQCKNASVLGDSLIGLDIFHVSTIGTQSVSAKELTKYRKNTIMRYYLRPKYIFRKVWECRKNPKVFANYFQYGMRLVSNYFRK